MSTPAQRVIDLKLPLTWLLGSAAALIFIVASAAWTASAQSSKLEAKIDLLIGANTKFEKRLDDRDVTAEVLRQKIQDVNSTTENLKWRLEAIERSATRK